MPRPRDQRLYFELQGKLTQQEVDYNNMHQHHTIVRAPQGKTTKIGTDDDLPPLLDYEATASIRASVIRDFVPAKSEQSPSKASEPLQNASAIIPHATATTLRTHNLPMLPTEPSRVVLDTEVEQAKQDLKEDAPNQNPEFTFEAVASRTRSKYKVKLNVVEKDRKEKKKEAGELDQRAFRDNRAHRQDVASRDKRAQRRDTNRRKADERAAAALKITKSKGSQVYTETAHSVNKRIGITVDKMEFK